MMRALFLILCLSFTCTALRAQEVRTLAGRKYTVHTVQAGQTLYAIARHYAVPVEALLKANPAASGGLSVGQVLLVPQDAVVKKELKGAPSLIAGELAHTVRKKETLYGIARIYSVEQAALLERNPGLAQGVREGMVVIIPVARTAGVNEQQLKPAVDDGATLHEVAAGETLYSLGQRYGVKPEAIQEANGGLPEGLKAGTTLRIPVVKEVVRPVAIAADSLTRKQRYRIAYMLPFSIDRNDSALADPLARDFDEYTLIGTQFCAGAMMAIDSAKARGLVADIGFYDTGTSAADWAPLMKLPAIKNADLFIGPFHRSAIEELTRVNRSAHIVCPVQQSNKVLLGHPNVSKTACSRADQIQELSRHAVAAHAMDNLILCRPEIPSESELQGQVLRVLQEALDRQPARAHDSVIIARPGRRDIADLQARLDPVRMNAIVLPSEDVEVVANVLGKLAGLAGKYRIVLYGLNAWFDMGSLDPADMDKVDLHLPSCTWIDMTDPRVIAFVRAFRDRFHTEPDAYAFLGYDVSAFYLAALQQQGTGFAEHYDRVISAPLHLELDMTRAGMENGWRNASCVMVEVKDMTARKVGNAAAGSTGR